MKLEKKIRKQKIIRNSYVFQNKLEMKIHEK